MGSYCWKPYVCGELSGQQWGTNTASVKDFGERAAGTWPCRLSEGVLDGKAVKVT